MKREHLALHQIFAVGINLTKPALCIEIKGNKIPGTKTWKMVLISEKAIPKEEQSILLFNNYSGGSFYRKMNFFKVHNF